MSGFGATTTADEVLEGKDLSGKTVLVTGGSSGLGQETARSMAAKGAHVIISARNPAQMEDVTALFSWRHEWVHDPLQQAATGETC